MYNGETFTHFTEKEGLSNNWVWSILEDSNGNLWFGTNGGVSMYDGKIFTHFTTNEGLSGNQVRSILEDRHGNLWFATRNGVSKYNGETFTHFTTKEGLSDNKVHSILEDSNGNLWFGTNGGGVSKYNGETFTYFTEKEGLSINLVSSIVEDSQGNVWIGTDGGGVSIFNRETFSHLFEQVGVSSKDVFSIKEDRQGNLWIGTKGAGVIIYNGETLTHFTEKEGLSNNDVRDILEDSNGNLWFGTNGGVSMYDGKIFTHFTEKEGLNSNNVWSILEDKHGNLWFGTLGGACMYNGETFTHFTEKEGLSNNWVWSIFEDSHGNLWFGTLGGGVSKYNGETFTHFTTKEGLSNNRVTAILEDHKGNIWFGTDWGGVCKYNGETFTNFTKQEGLCDNMIWSVFEDSNHSIWLGTEKGINRIVFGKDSLPPVIESYSQQSGLKALDFGYNSVYQDTKNRIWWGNGKGLTMLDLNNFNNPVDPPRNVQLDRLDINDQYISYRQLNEETGINMKFDSVARFSNYPVNLELHHNSNHLTFYFSAIDWAAPHKIKYSYKMEGLKEKWSMPTSDATADYRNLSYGKYTFNVRVIGVAQKWSEPFAYTFTIHPPWWLTWWAYSIYAVSAFVLIIFIFRWRTAKLMQRQKKLEHTVKRRTVEISEKNEELNQQNDDLASQKEEIMAQRDEIATQIDLVTAQKDQIIEQKQAMTDSIRYASKIQTAILPPDEVLKYLLPKHFILYKPRNIVSGDFYWLTQKGEKIIIVVADCTGHGVPGAFMSMLGSALLKDVINSIESLDAGLILDDLRDQVMASLRQTGKTDEAKDGMDIALCVLDIKNKTLQFAGGFNPLYLIRNGELIEIKADKMPIGISSKAGKSFTNHELTLQKSDAFYMFSDGYVDQFGGPKGKKFMTIRFKQLLLEIQDNIMFEQKEILEQTLNDWMGIGKTKEKKYEQIDDIIVMGIKI